MPERAIHPEGAGPRMDVYYLDRHLTLAESTRRFSEDGRGRDALEEKHFVVAIRRRDHLGWVFRFSHYEETTPRSIVETLNRLEDALPSPWRR